MLPLSQKMIDLSAAHAAIIKQILEKKLPNDEVIVFGSRANGTAKPYSDIDLAVISKDGLDRNKLWELREAFEESDLPFCVDIVEYDKLSEKFKKEIMQNCKRI